MLENKKYNQKAAKGSTQIQIDTLNIGLDKNEALQLIKKENERAIVELGIIATKVAADRLEKYTDVLLPKLVHGEVIKSFMSPEIQMLYRRSEKTAICTDRKKDYELLSELLVYRITKNENYTIKAAMSKAIDEINNMSDDALLGLALLFSIQTYTPKTANVREGLLVLDKLFGEVLKEMTLPTNYDWIDNLEITGAIRRGGGTIKKMEDIYFSNKGFYSRGIKKGTPNYSMALELLKNCNIPKQILIDNELDKNYVLLDHFNPTSFDDISFYIIKDDGEKIKQQINSFQVEMLKQVFGLYENSKVDENEFKKLFNSYKNINIISEWWDKYLTKVDLSLTAVGQLIGNIYMRNIDVNLPDIGVFKVI